MARVMWGVGCLSCFVCCVGIAPVPFAARRGRVSRGALALGPCCQPALRFGLRTLSLKQGGSPPPLSDSEVRPRTSDATPPAEEER